MTPNEMTIARLMIRVKIHESDGTVFEKLFTQIMTLSNPNFQQIKPNGKVGDRKNDGFDKNTGEYYQVYSPENPTLKLNQAIKKLNTDFDGLNNYWDSISKIETYYFVYNDKYRGVPPELEKEMSELRKKNITKKFRIFSAKDLEEIFTKLPLSSIQSVVGFIPQEKIGLINLGVMTNIVQHLITNWHPPTSVEKLVSPDYEEKIQFNNLNDSIGTLLKTANYQVSVTEKYFEHKPDEKSLLKEIFIAIYDEAKKTFTDPNEMFIYLLNKATPDGANSKDVIDAIMVLISVYFEACDIFEEPK